MKCLESYLFSKMHGSGPGIKAFPARLSIIETVDFKFTSRFPSLRGQILHRTERFAFPKVLVPLEAAFQPIWVKLLLTSPILARLSMADNHRSDLLFFFGLILPLSVASTVPVVLMLIFLSLPLAR